MYTPKQIFIRFAVAIQWDLFTIDFNVEKEHKEDERNVYTTACVAFLEHEYPWLSFAQNEMFAYRLTWKHLSKDEIEDIYETIMKFEPKKEVNY